MESRLSRYDEAPPLLIADQLRANLIEQGWRDRPAPLWTMILPLDDKND